MTTRLWDSTCQSACQRPTSWSDRMRLRSQETTQATDIISNQGVFHTAHVTLCPKPHTDMLSWIPRIPQPVSTRRGQATVSIYWNSWGSVFSLLCFMLRGLKNHWGRPTDSEQVHLSPAAHVTLQGHCVYLYQLLGFTSANSTVHILMITPLQFWV